MIQHLLRAWDGVSQRWKNVLEKKALEGQLRAGCVCFVMLLNLSRESMCRSFQSIQSNAQHF